MKPNARMPMIGSVGLKPGCGPIASRPIRAASITNQALITFAILSVALGLVAHSTRGVQTRAHRSFGGLGPHRRCGPAAAGGRFLRWTRPHKKICSSPVHFRERGLAVQRAKLMMRDRKTVGAVAFSRKRRKF